MSLAAFDLEIAKIPMDGVALAVASAIHNAVGVRLNSRPFTPERVRRGWVGDARVNGQRQPPGAVRRVPSSIQSGASVSLCTVASPSTITPAPK